MVIKKRLKFNKISSLYIKYNLVFEILIILVLLGVQNIVKELSIIIMVNMDMIRMKIDLLLDSNGILITP